MIFKVVRTFAMPPDDYEQEVLSKAGASMEVASFMPGACTEEELLSIAHDADAVISVFEPFTRRVIEGLEKTHAQGIRYPIPTYMRYSPEVALSLPLSDIFTEVDLSGIGKKK